MPVAAIFSDSYNEESKKEADQVKKEVPLKVTIGLIPLAAALCLFGIYRGEVALIFTKAINVCMECIGLG